MNGGPPAMKTTKAGRKRSIGARHPSGKLVQTGVPAPAAVRRAVATAMAGAAEASLATQLGWMRLRNEITDRQMAAGIGFARLFDAHATVCGFPRRAPPAQSIEFRSAGKNDGDIDADIVRATRERYQRATAALQAIGCLNVVVDVCVDDQFPEWARKTALLRGLDELVAHFRI